MAATLNKIRGTLYRRLVETTNSMRPWNFGEIKTRFNKADDEILESQLAGGEEVEIGIIFGYPLTPHNHVSYNLRYTLSAMGTRARHRQLVT
jgi:hypothetical protein